MITWDLKITPIDIGKKEASVIATRIDDTGPDNPKVYKVSRAPFKTAAQKTAVWNEIWAKHQTAIAGDSIINDFVSALEGTGKSDLEARE